jgi:hypothetical protein
MERNLSGRLSFVCHKSVASTESNMSLFDVRVDAYL